jgi:hypothetical protein
MTRNLGPPTGRRSIDPVVQQLISMFVATVLVTAIAVVAIAVSGGPPPRLALAGITWLWTGSTASQGGFPLVVPDPAAYTIRFDGDRGFVAVADCDEATGIYSVIPAGRAGGGTNRLTLVTDAPAVASCGAESLAVTFMQQLGSASRYVIAGDELTITLASRGEMTFEAVIPAASPTQGG